MEEQWESSIANIANPFAEFTNRQEYNRRRDIASGRINTLITYNLQVLRAC
jgi:hypothetical protein